MQQQSLANFTMPNNNLMATFKIFPSNLDYKFDQMTLGINIKPYGMGSEEQVKEINFGPKGIVRCNVCKGYMNPMNKIFKNQNTFECCLCKTITEIPPHYVEGFERQHMTYDIVPSPQQFKSDFFSSNPYVTIVIENTENLMLHGLQDMIKSAIEAALELLDPDQNILLMTYDMYGASYYDLTKEEPFRYVLTDVEDRPFRLKHNRVIESKKNLMTVLSCLDELRPQYQSIRSNVGLAVRAMDSITRILMGIGGRVIHIMTNSQEFRMAQQQNSLLPAFASCTQLVERCSRHAITYSLFLVTDLPSAVVTLSDLPRLTLGSMRLYRRTEMEAYQLYYDLVRQLSQQMVYGCTVRVRTSATIKTVDKKAIIESPWRIHFLHNNTAGLTNFNSITPETTVPLELQLSKNIDDKYLIIQNSLLLTDFRCIKRLRISNLVIPLSADLKVIRQSCDIETHKAYLARKFIQLLMRNRNISLNRQHIITYAKKIYPLLKSCPWVEDLLIMCLAMLKSKIFPASIKLTQKTEIDQMWFRIVDTLSMSDWQIVQKFIPHFYQNNTMISLTKTQQNCIYTMDSPHKIIVLFNSKQPTISMEQAYEMVENTGQLSDLIRQLRSYKRSGYLPISYILFANQSDDYLEFVNSMVLNKGNCGYNYDLGQFKSILS